MNEVSQTTLQIIQYLFRPDQRNEVEHILISECGHNLISERGTDWDRSRERVQLAVLKISDGDTDKLLSAIELVQTDYRDLLMAAGFGHSIDEHQVWAREILAQQKG